MRTSTLESSFDQRGMATEATPQIILASTSPYRRALLQRLIPRFAVHAPGVEEEQAAKEAVEAMARRLAMAKAQAVAAHFPQALVIASDQAATLDGLLAIGKPGCLARAREQLRAASGQTMRFHTAVALIGESRGVRRLEVVDTVVRYRVLDEASIDRYLAREAALDCTGAAKCEALGIALMARIESPDPTALVGLPLIALTQMLFDAGVDVLAIEDEDLTAPTGLTAPTAPTAPPAPTAPTAIDAAIPHDSGARGTDPSFPQGPSDGAR